MEVEDDKYLEKQKQEKKHHILGSLRIEIVMLWKKRTIGKELVYSVIQLLDKIVDCTYTSDILVIYEVLYKY